ncbi:hypothetical protein FRC12_010222 [Ceratobasidium sp. 428]|nr:hypothetical protein FRC12_010222 [Ceratobasidium sp. 428]
MQSNCHSLANGSLSHAPANDPQFLLLAVAVGDNALPGPHHDLNFLHQHLQSKILTTVALGPDATHENIRPEVQKILSLAEQLCIPVILHFNGHSDDGCALKLCGGCFIGPDIVLNWVSLFRKDRHIPVFLVFEHCRKGLALPYIPEEIPENISIIWSTSPGQFALDTDLGNDTPYSDLLKAAYLVLRQLLINPSDPPGHFLSQLRLWMSLITRVRLDFTCKRYKCPIPWSDCPCLYCFARELCDHPAHRGCEGDNGDGSGKDTIDTRPIQVPTGQFWPLKSDVQMNGVAQILRSSGLEKHILEVGNHILGHPLYKDVPITCKLGIPLIFAMLHSPTVSITNEGKRLPRKGDDMAAPNP